jgi:hypothetical protein
MSMLPADAHRRLHRPVNLAFTTGLANPITPDAHDRRFFVVPQPAPTAHQPETTSATMEALATLPTAISLAALPALGQPLAGGIFAGLTTKPDGTHHAVALLPNTPADKLKWDAAMAWAKDLDADLPSRPVAALLFATSRNHFEQAWYWTSETDEDDGSYACYQNFGYGGQYDVLKSWQGRARAVRLIQLTA